MYIDSHAHIDGPEFDGDRQAVVDRAHAAGVGVILNVGTGDPHSGSLQRAAALTQVFPNIFAAVGVHPHDARLYDGAVGELILEIIQNNARVVAWGEIGLDYHYDHSPREVQIQVFERQLELAGSLQLPVIIHSRAADDDTVRCLRAAHDRGWGGGIMHCFGGSERMADEVLELGMLVSFAGNVTFKKADELRAAARRVPLDRLLIETDCPYLTPIPFRGQRNEPARVVETARFLAERYDVTPEELGERTSENFARFFALNLEDLAAEHSAQKSRWPLTPA